MKFSHLSDDAIVAEFQKGGSIEDNSRLLGEIIQRFYKDVLSACCNYVEDREVAQDLTQEVWIRVITKMPQFDRRKSFRPWLFTIVKNRCYDHLHQDKKMLHQEISYKIMDGLEENLDIGDEASPTIEILEELMEKISSEGKLILVLRYYKGWSVRLNAFNFI